MHLDDGSSSRAVAESRLSLLGFEKVFWQSWVHFPGYYVFQLCNGSYKVYLTPIFGRVFK